MRSGSRCKSVSSREEDLANVISDEDMVVSDARRASSTSSRKRKRRRLPTTEDPSKGIPCDYHVKLARQVKEMEEKKKQRERDKCYPTVKSAETAARRKLAKDMDSEEELMREFRLAPTSDIQAQVLEMMDRVDKGAVCSNSIKGTVVIDMRRAAVINRAAMSVLSLRTAIGPDASTAEQLEEMHLGMASMRRENERLKLQLDSLRRRLQNKENTGTDKCGMEEMRIAQEPEIRLPSPRALSPQSPMERQQPSQSVCHDSHDSNSKGDRSSSSNNSNSCNASNNSNNNEIRGSSNTSSSSYNKSRRVSVGNRNGSDDDTKVCCRPSCRR